jgi:Rod binding domain-containing protein
MLISTNPDLSNESIATASGNVTQTDPASSDSPKSTKAEKAIKDFESLFMSMMIKEMRQTSSGEGLFPGDASDTYGGMFDMFLGKELAEGKGLGLETIFRSSKVMSDLGNGMDQSRTLIDRKKAIEGYRNEQLRTNAVPSP